MRFWLALAVIAAIAVPPRAQTPPPATPAAGKGIITGRVLDAERGSAVAGATVVLSVSGQASGRASRIMTDEQGRFFFRDLAKGSYSLVATKPGFAPGAHGRRRPAGPQLNVELREDERRGDITISLWRYGVVSGRVIDEAGDPLVDIDVRMFQQTFPAGAPQLTLIAKIETDDRGMYRFWNLLPGSYIVGVPATVTSEPPALAAEARTGAPPVYMQTMTSVGAAPRSFNRAEVPVGPSGVLVSGLLGMRQAPAAGSAWLTYATTFHPSTTSVSSAGVIRVAPGRENAGVDVTVKLVPTYRVSGTVLQPDGRPASLHAIHLIPADAADNPVVETSTAVTDNAGVFTFFGVPPGQYIARVVKIPIPAGGRMGIASMGGRTDEFIVLGRGPGPGPMPIPTDPLLWADERVTVVDSDVTSVSMGLRAGPRVIGRAELDGSAPRPTAAEWRNMQVQMEPASGAPTNNVLTPGRFTEEGLCQVPSTWPGRYLVRASNAPPRWTFRGAMYQGRDISETPIDLRSDLEGVVLSFTDAPNKIDGGVQGADGQPDAGAIVLLFPVEPEAWKDYGRTSRRVRSVRATDGRFTFSAVPDGDYYLAAIPDELASDWQGPAMLQRIAPLADRTSITAGQSVSHSLRTRRLQ